MASYGVPPVLLRWVHAFLLNRKQRVRIGQETSDWGKTNGGVPQGTKLGPLLFITMINDMELSLPTVKYVDDSSAYEILYLPTKKEIINGATEPISRFQEAATEADRWTKDNNARLNTIKTKEMCISFIKNYIPPPDVIINGIPIEKVDMAKTLGIIVSKDLKWQKHVEYVYSKAAPRVYFLCMLRHAAVPPEDLVEIYVAILRPLLEYACQVWHPGLNKHQELMLESVQKRALKIIFPKLKYEDALEKTGLPLLVTRRKEMCHNLFRKIQNSEHRLHKLLPPKRDNSHNLRHSRQYEPPLCSTNRYKNTFIPYCLYQFQ